MIAPSLLLLLGGSAVQADAITQAWKPRGYAACMRGAFLPMSNDPPLAAQLRRAMEVCADERAAALRQDEANLSELHPEWTAEQVRARAGRGMAQWEARILYFETERLRNRDASNE
jgi:hypothetical protein